MPPQTSQDSFKEANRHNDSAASHASHAFADFGAAISETWSAGMSRVKGVGQSVSEGVQAAGNEIARENRDISRAVGQAADATGRMVGQAADATGRAAHQAADAAGGAYHQAADATGRFAHRASEAVQAAGNEVARENRDIARAAGQAYDATGRVIKGAGDAIGGAATAVGTEASREAGVVGGVLHKGYDAAAGTASAAGHRIGDHYRDRPVTAILEGPLGPVDGLMRGGIAPSDRDHGASPERTATRTATLPTDTSTSTTRRDAPATPTSTAEHLKHHVEKGESYYSIAAEQGGSRQEIVNRMNHLQELNHNKALLPNLEIVMS